MILQGGRACFFVLSWGRGGFCSGGCHPPHPLTAERGGAGFFINKEFSLTESGRDI